jgi:lipopolysaccharide biosynthesis glycosyltransferase
MSADIVFAIDGNYAEPAVVVGASVQANLTDPGTRLRFHVLDGGLDGPARRRVVDGLGRLGEVAVYPVPDPLLLPHPVKHWTSAALGRLHVGSVLPADVTRAVYLDADTLVLGDITELLDFDLGGATVGASINEVGADRSWRLGETAVYSDEGAAPPGYFNSGVLLMDMARWRATGVTERAREIYQRYGHQLRTHDQDVLNIIFSGAWVPFPAKWNKLVEHSVHGRFGNGRLDYLTEHDGIVHFIGGVKPWHGAFPQNSLKELYERYAATPVHR